MSILSSALKRVAKELAGAAAKSIGEKGEVVGHRLADRLRKPAPEPESGGIP